MMMAESCSHSSTRLANTTAKGKKYYVVEFTDGVAVVSYSWLRSPKQENQGFTCYWPDGQTSSRVRRMAKEHAPVNQNEWTIHDVRPLASSDDWDRVLEKEIKSQETSCLDTEEEDISPRVTKRQSRPPSRYIYDEEDVSMSMDEESQMPRPPKVPKFTSVPSTRVHCSTREGLSTTTSARRCSTPNLSPVGRSVEHLASPRGSNTGFEKTVLKLLTELSLELKELKKQVEHNSSLLVELTVSDQNKDDALDMEDVDLPVTLPLSTVADVQNLETSLEDQALAKKLVEKLAVLSGGKDIAGTTKVVMSTVMSTELARRYNWTGAKGKEVFQKLNLVKVILRAVRRNSKTKDATREDVKEAITHFLYNSRDRNGGRKARGAPNRPAIAEQNRDTQEEDRRNDDDNLADDEL